MGKASMNGWCQAKNYVQRNGNSVSKREDLYMLAFSLEAFHRYKGRFKHLTDQPWWADHDCRPAPSVEEAWQGSFPHRKGGGGCIFWTRKFHHWKRCVCVYVFFYYVSVCSISARVESKSDRIKPYTLLWHNMPCGFFFLMVHVYFSLVIPIKLGQHPRGQGREDLPSVELNSCGRQKSSGMVVIATGMGFICKYVYMIVWYYFTIYIYIYEYIL